jgi:hypothetical protein
MVILLDGFLIPQACWGRISEGAPGKESVSPDPKSPVLKNCGSIFPIPVQNPSGDRIYCIRFLLNILMQEHSEHTGCVSDSLILMVIAGNIGIPALARKGRSISITVPLPACSLPGFCRHALLSIFLRRHPRPVPPLFCCKTDKNVFSGWLSIPEPCR